MLSTEEKEHYSELESIAGEGVNIKPMIEVWREQNDTLRLPTNDEFKSYIIERSFPIADYFLELCEAKKKKNQQKQYKKDNGEFNKEDDNIYRQEGKVKKEDVSENEELSNFLIECLEKQNFQVEILSNEELINIYNELNNSNIKLGNKTLYGFTYNDIIYLNNEHLNPNSIIHEFTHIWYKSLKTLNPKLYQNVKNIITNEKIEKELKEFLDKNYEGLDEDDYVSEVLARISGKKGRANLERLIEEKPKGTKKLFAKPKKYIEEFWNWIGENLLGIKEFKNSDEIVDRILYDIINDKRENKKG